MTIHKSLAIQSNLMRARNVLKRWERLQRLRTEGSWNAEADSPLGIRKTRVTRKAVAKKSE